jgi:glycosyltransferase-like protein
MNSAPSLHIALLTHSVRPRGGVVHTLELAEALTALGHRITVIASAEPGESLFRSVAHGLELIRLPELSGDIVTQVRQRIATLAEALPALLPAGRFDLVHAQDSLSGNALATLREQGRLPIAWLRTVHHLDVFHETLLNQWQKRAWRSADAVCCVSDTWLQHLRDEHGCHAERMFNGVNLQRYRHARTGERDSDDAALRSLGLRDGPVCLLVGGVEARKNTVRLLHAFARLRAQDAAWADAQLVVAGGASMLDHRAARREWVEALELLGLVEGPGEAVLRTGPLADEQLPPLMRRARMLAMPSLVEGFGLVALEALACGTPVLVSERPPFTEHLRGCASVAWCDPEEVGSIASGLQRAMQLPRPAEPPAVCRQHSWGHSAQRHEDWYRRTLRSALPLSSKCGSATLLEPPAGGGLGAARPWGRSEPLPVD